MKVLFILGPADGCWINIGMEVEWEVWEVEPTAPVVPTKLPADPLLFPSLTTYTRRSIYLKGAEYYIMTPKNISTKKAIEALLNEYMKFS